MNVLSTHNLHKQYGRITAVNQLNLEIKEGSVFGLLGPNGSGKTTTLGMILDVTVPTSGSFQWFDEDPSHEHRKQVGAILEKPNFYPSMSAFKNLEVACMIKSVSPTRIPEVLEQVDLLGREYDSFRTYSLGMKQRLAIASALLSHPKVLILDEPTNGLDPKGIAEIRELIISIAHTGKTIILASHLLDEVQKVCSEFAVLRNGSLIHQGKVDEDFNDNVSIEVGVKDLLLLESIVQAFPNYISHKLKKDKIMLDCQTGTSAEELNRFLASHGQYANHLVVIKKNLEQKFMEIVSTHA